MRGRLALLETEIGATSKAPRLLEAVAESLNFARTTAQAPLLGARAVVSTELLYSGRGWRFSDHATG